MNTGIHPTAIVSSKAKIGKGVSIQPYAIIDDYVEIGDDCIIGPHAVIYNFVKMGKGNKIHAHAVIGDLPQDIGFDNSETWVEIGDFNVFREGVKIHRATSPKRITRVGNNCYLMANSHIGHDCIVADNVILTINVGIGGHVSVGEGAVFGGGVLVHQFCRIGAFSMLAAFTIARKDVLPFCMVAGEPLKHYRLNSIGLRRNGIKGDAFKVVEQAFRQISRGEKNLDNLQQTSQIKFLKNWLEQPSKRGLTGFLKK